MLPTLYISIFLPCLFWGLVHSPQFFLAVVRHLLWGIFLFSLVYIVSIFCNLAWYSICLRSLILLGKFHCILLQEKSDWLSCKSKKLELKSLERRERFLKINVWQHFFQFYNLENNKYQLNCSKYIIITIINTIYIIFSFTMCFCPLRALKSMYEDFSLSCAPQKCSWEIFIFFALLNGAKKIDNYGTSVDVSTNSKVEQGKHESN